MNYYINQLISIVSFLHKTTSTAIKPSLSLYCDMILKLSSTQCFPHLHVITVKSPTLFATSVSQLLNCIMGHEI